MTSALRITLSTKIGRVVVVAEGQIVADGELSAVLSDAELLAITL